ALSDVDPATASIASRLTAPWVDRIALGPKSRMELRDGLDALAPSRERSFPEVAGSIGDGAMLDTQLRDGDPPETGATFTRLLGEGVEEKEARRLIGCVIAAEIFAVMKSKKSFDRERFVGRLETLPEMPWQEE